MKNTTINVAVLLVFVFCFSVNARAKSTLFRETTPANADFLKVKDMAYADSLQSVELFKDIHQNPELGFMETRTSAIITKKLQMLGYKVITGIGKTGLAGILQNGEGPVVMYRAEMDALPIKETTGLDYASTVMVKKEDNTVVPVMHACGHDSHITWMLGVAKIMASMKSRWKGTLVFIAQPAEEIMQGAEAMVKDNLYNRGVPMPDYSFAMHTLPLPVGVVVNTPGIIMAGADQFDVTFHGIGGHGSVPHLAKDPVIMAATAILEYQTLVNRSVSAQNPHVITVGAVDAGTANNIIPVSATLKVNLRWFDIADRANMIAGINRVDSSIAFANNLPGGLYPTMSIKGMVYPVNNDQILVNKLNAAFGEILPFKNILSHAHPEMASEDFPMLISSIKRNAVYDYLYIGIASPGLYEQAMKEGKEFPFNKHNPDFQVDLSAIPFGTTIGAAALLELFKK